MNQTHSERESNNNMTAQSMFRPDLEESLLPHQNNSEYMDDMQIRSAIIQENEEALYKSMAFDKFESQQPHHRYDPGLTIQGTGIVERHSNESVNMGDISFYGQPVEISSLQASRINPHSSNYNLIDKLR